MTVQLCEDKTRNLTDTVWDHWINQGTEPRKMTWLEVKNLADYFLKICIQHNKDNREYDFSNLLDYKLTYIENRAEIKNQVGYDINSREKEAAGKLKDYLSDEQLNEYSATEKNIIEGIENTNKTLTKKVSLLSKKMETQQIDPEALRKELDTIQETQSQIYARLENIPNLNQLVLALEKSQNFKKIGEAIRPITTNLPETKQIQPKKPTLSSWLKAKHYNPLDLFAVFVVTIMFAGLSYGIISWLSLTWGSIVGLSVLWLVYVVVARLVAGGLLN
jgi:hypothetical protein